MDTDDQALASVEAVLTSDVPPISELGLYTTVFPRWIAEVVHWREVFKPHQPSEVTIKSILARWLTGESPPLKCSLAECMHYCHMELPFCQWHCCTSMGCINMRNMMFNLRYCDAHQCAHMRAGVFCSEERLPMGLYPTTILF